MESPKDPILIADGYNILMAWETAKRMELSHAREMLMDKMDNYAGATETRCILVFDGHQVENNPGSVEQHGGVEVVYTRTGQSADQYIERLCYELSRVKAKLSVVTGDGLIQSLALGMGALRITPKEFIVEMERAGREAMGHATSGQQKNHLFSGVDADTLMALERMRRQ
ncbi:MAG: NYN domain-containing protein [Clostridiales bacterium]|nr:NYN domain-containing protein [Clostridiales bacterium]